MDVNSLNGNSTSSEPRDVVKGKYYLYIDDSQLKKMASDPKYRGQVYGLMDREYTTGQEYTLTYSDGVNKTMHLTGSVFSLSEANRKYAGPDGIPYHGSCTSDNSISSSTSHVQVRSQSFLYDHLDPVKSARKSRTLAARSQAEKLAEKRAEKKKIAAKEAKKAEQKRSDEKREAKRIAEKEHLEELLSEAADSFDLDKERDPGYYGTSALMKAGSKFNAAV